MNTKEILTVFSHARAKIDFIKLQATEQEKWQKNPLLIEALECGRLHINGGPSGSNEIYLTLHDPTVDELMVFHNSAPQMMIREIEFSVDWHLKDRSNDFGQLEILRRRLVQNLHPQMGGKVTRKFYDLQRSAIIKDAMNSHSHNTVYWKERREWIQVRCYIKTRDANKPIDNYSVRIEVTLGQGALVEHAAHRICLLPDLINSLQRNLSGYLYAASEIRLPRRRCRSKNHQTQVHARHDAIKAQRKADRIWKWSGAMGAQQAGYAVKPDSILNRQTGRALSRLKEKMLYGDFVPQLCPEILDELRHEYDVIQ